MCRKLVSGIFDDRLAGRTSHPHLCRAPEALVFYSAACIPNLACPAEDQCGIAPMETSECLDAKCSDSFWSLEAERALLSWRMLFKAWFSQFFYKLLTSMHMHAI